MATMVLMEAAVVPLSKTVYAKPKMSDPVAAVHQCVCMSARFSSVLLSKGCALI